MSRIEGCTSFARTPDEVFDFLADPRHEPAYNPLVVSARKETPGPIVAGSRFVQRVKSFRGVGDVSIASCGLSSCGRAAGSSEGSGPT